MKLLFDFFPILLFFAAYKFSDIYVATGVGIVATIAQIAWARWHKGKVEPLQWIALAIIVVFGGLTIWLHDNTFIRIKPTILYWTLGLAIGGGQLFMKRSPMKAVMGSELELPDAAWRGLGWSWVAFFAMMGALNLWVAFNYSEATWVNFKAIGGIGLMLLFIFAQALYLSRYIKVEEAEAND
jgi:intracellular septation protein